MINWITETISRIRVSIQPIELAYPSLNTLKPDSYMYWNKDTLDVPGPCSINGSLNIFQLSAVSVNGRWYYMNSSGAMQTGWQRLNGQWYYLDPSGAMLTGWQAINGKWYYLGSNGVMYANTTTPDGRYVDGSGALQ